jgi:uncharacterized iron-regulated membrane protein
MNFSQLNRVGHRWGALIVALPVLIMILSGLILLLKKESNWIQPPSQRGTTQTLSVSFDQLLAIAQGVPQAQIKTWNDIDRLDVRPSKGMVKVRAKNRWEIQIDSHSGAVLQVAYRRSDLIESLHDGSFFHDRVRLWIFLPAGVILLVLWFSGIYLFYSYQKRRYRYAEH